MVASRTLPPLRPQNLWIIHGALLMSVFVYGGIGFVLSMSRTARMAEMEGGPVDGGGPLAGGALGSGAPGVSLETLGTIFMAVGLLAAAAGTLLPRLIPALNPPDDASAEVYLGGRLRTMVISDALYEVPALLGFLALVMGLPQFSGLLLLGLAAAGMLSMTPRISGWISEFEARMGKEGRG
jgi:hypothetical protein